MGRTLLQGLLDLPGRFHRMVFRASPRLPASPLSRDEVRALILSSPRGNAYLSMEDFLTVFGDEGGVLTWAGHGRLAFAVGGIHGCVRGICVGCVSHVFCCGG